MCGGDVIVEKKSRKSQCLHRRADDLDNDIHVLRAVRLMDERGRVIVVAGRKSYTRKQ